MLDLYVMRDPEVWDDGKWWRAGGVTGGEWDALSHGAFGLEKLARACDQALSHKAGLKVAGD